MRARLRSRYIFDSLTRSIDARTRHMKGLVTPLSGI